MRPAARVGRSTRSRRPAPSAATRRRSASPPLASRGARWIAPRFGVDVRPARSPRASAPRSSSARCRTGCICATRPRHRPVSRGRRTRPTRWARSSPAAAPVPVPVDAHWRLDLDAIDDADAERALCLWVNEPGNPTGRARRPRRRGGVGRAHGVRCSATSATPSSRGTARRARSSSTAPTAWSRCTRCRSDRTSRACASASTPATPSSSATSREVRKHAGLMVPGPVQAAGVAALGDDEHVERAAARYRAPPRTHRRGASDCVGVDGAAPPGGSTSGWRRPTATRWAFTAPPRRGGRARQPRRLLRPGGAGHVRIASCNPTTASSSSLSG